VLKLKTPWRDGTTPLVMSMLEFIQRLAALVLRPRQQLIRFDGLLASDGEPRAHAAPPGDRERQEPRRKGTVVSRIRTAACGRVRATSAVPKDRSLTTRFARELSGRNWPLDQTADAVVVRGQTPPVARRRPVQSI
jgi:hypothetical protein